jgi:sulfatase maturation enzyme AslB (radical SAM superfamily)|tara:strand:+ start:2407 stop:4044 length:1638 start_codon:yes stop_codon:yes gene_type:complete
MSIYDQAADKAEKQLDAISPTMCYAKWSQVSMHLTNGTTHSCYHPPTHKIPLEELAKNVSALHNTEEKKDQRRQMLKGEKPDGCSYCWNIEDTGARSDRVYRSGEYWAQDSKEDIMDAGASGNINPRYVEVNFNQACNFKCSYCSPHLSTAWQEEIDEFGEYPTTAPHNNVESLDRKGLMPLKLSQDNNPYVTAFWKWWPEMYKTLRVFRMTGGEPLMDKNTFKVLDYVLDNPNKDLELSITSNMCPVNDALFVKFLNAVKKMDNVQHGAEVYVTDPLDGTDWQTWQHSIIGEDAKRYHSSELPVIEREAIPQTFLQVGQCEEQDNNSFTYIYEYNDKAYHNFSVFCSLDGWGEQAEYMRSGMDFDTVWNNCHRFLDETRFTSINFINTFNCLSVTSFKEFLQGILDLREKWSKEVQYSMGWEVPEQRIWFDVPLLRAPAWQSIQVLPGQYQEYMQEAIQFMEQNKANEEYVDYKGFKDFEIAKVKRNLEFMKAELPHDKLIRDRADFYKFFTEHDRRRNTNYLATFPEMHDFWFMCEEAEALNG